jgi:DNA-binding MarR family transcriptional regulator
MERPAKDSPPTAPRELAQLDPLLQHRSRLGALVLLSGSDALTFSRLKTLLDETDGNLGAQLRKLEEAQYVAVKKEFVERKPTSWYSLTSSGQKALKRHLTAIESLLKSAKL